MGKIRSKGAKLKFSIGEKVLCYEPDPRKPKLLFESKILNIFSNKVERGRKVYEYLIHFLGFNKRYDHCVREEFILPFTEENQTLQKKLDEEARLKYKKNCKDSSSINENLARKMHTKKDSGKTKQKSAPHSSSADTESEYEFEIEMDLSDVLRGILEQDFLLIKNQKLIRLPCEMNVISILEDYMKYVAARCVLAPKDIHKNIDMESMAAEFELEMKLCIEAMHGIRIYFDHTLRPLLLYPEEKQQFYTFGHTCAPIFDPSRYEALSLEDALLEFERVLEDDNESNEPEFIDSEAALNNSQVQFETENEELSDADIIAKIFGDSDDDEEFEGFSIEDIESRQIIDCSKIKKEYEENSEVEFESESEELSDAEIIAKIFGDSDDDEEFEGFSIEDIESGQTEDCAKSKKEDQDLARKIISKTIRSMQDTGKLKPPTAEDSSSSITTTKRTIINFDCPSDPCCSTQAAQELEYPKSTITTRRASFISNLAIEVEKYNRKVLNEMAYRMVPQDLYNVPAAPSLIYGAHHLLRLFVKLPALISKQGIEEGKLRILLEILVDFLSFLIRKRKSFFKRSDYMSDTEAFPITID